jgi:SAM-dependent methyltransferase
LGFVHESKGHDLLIEAFKDVEGKLLIAGDSRLEEHKPYLGQLKARGAQLGIEDKVRFLGYVSDEELPIVLSATDIMVLPYRKIRQSGILNLSLAYHLPTIASGLPYFVELKEKSGCVHIMGDSLAEQYARANSYRNTIFNLYMTYLEVAEAEHPDAMYKDKRSQERVKFLKENTSPNGRTLEVGCATGYVLNKVCQNAGVGIDTRKDRLLLARSRYPHLDFILASGHRLPFKGSSFDTVLLPEVLEHVDYDIAKEMVREAKRVGNRILFTVPQASGKWGPLADHKWLPNRGLVLSLAEGVSIKVENRDFIYGVIDNVS